MVAKKAKKQEDIAKAVQAMKEYTEMAAKDGLTTMTLGGGTVVKLRRLPPLLIQRLEVQFAEPEPPMVEVDVRGRKERQPNPDDPNYLKELDAARSKKGRAFLNLALLKGLEFEMPEGNGWLKELEAAGMEVGDSEAERRLAYIESVLIMDLREMTEVTSRVLAMSGVTPRAVDEATKTVPG